jgi:hypothetical protein
MDWQRERDGLLVVGTVVLLLLAVAFGGTRGFVGTFAATFLGVLAALRVNGVLGGGSDTTDGRAAAARTAAGGPSAVSTGVVDPTTATPSSGTGSTRTAADERAGSTSESAASSTASTDAGGARTTDETQPDLLGGESGETEDDGTSAPDDPAVGRSDEPAER